MSCCRRARIARSSSRAGLDDVQDAQRAVAQRAVDRRCPRAAGPGRRRHVGDRRRDAAARCVRRTNGSGASSPTRRTSCARRSPRSGNTPRSRARIRRPPTCASSRRRSAPRASASQALVDGPAAARPARRGRVADRARRGGSRRRGARGGRPAAGERARDRSARPKCDAARVLGDPRYLDRLVRNLGDNAAHHAAASRRPVARRERRARVAHRRRRRPRHPRGGPRPGVRAVRPARRGAAIAANGGSGLGLGDRARGGAGPRRRGHARRQPARRSPRRGAAAGDVRTSGSAAAGRRRRGRSSRDSSHRGSRAAAGPGPSPTNTGLAGWFSTTPSGSSNQISGAPSGWDRATRGRAGSSRRTTCRRRRARSRRAGLPVRSATSSGTPALPSSMIGTRTTRRACDSTTSSASPSAVRQHPFGNAGTASLHIVVSPPGATRNSEPVVGAPLARVGHVEVADLVERREVRHPERTLVGAARSTS